MPAPSTTSPANRSHASGPWRVAVLSLGAAGICLARSGIGAVPTSPPELAAIVGTFNCTTHDSAGAVWHFHSVNKAWGKWVRADTTFPPQHGQPADTASTFVGFDAQTQRWNIVSIDTDGSYYTRYSTSKTFDGSHWLDGYPADGAKALIRVQGRQQYTFELMSPGKKGRIETSDTTCKRA